MVQKLQTGSEYRSLNAVEQVKVPACNSYFTGVPWTSRFFLGGGGGQFKVLVLTYKALYGLGPGCLKDHLLLESSAWLLRATGGDLLQVPSKSEARSVGTTKMPW